jgi:putative endonuclease
MPIGYVYILRCNNGRYYTGSTIDLERRLAQHFSGNGANYTKENTPVDLVYVERHSRIDFAFEREKQIQNWSQAKKEALINNKKHKLHSLASCKNKTSHKNYKK